MLFYSGWEELWLSCDEQSHENEFQKVLSRLVFPQSAVYTVYIIK